MKACVAFTSKEMVSIIICMLLAKWTEQMMAADMKPYSMEVSELKGYLPGLQKTQSSDSAIPIKPGKYGGKGKKRKTQHVGKIRKERK